MQQNNQKIKERFAMSCILLGIQNSIYTSVDSCKTARALWERVRRHMEGIELTNEIQTEQASKHHNPLALVAHAYTAPQKTYASQASYAPQPYHVTHPSSRNMIFDNTENQSYDFQADEDNDDPVENLNKAMMLLARSFTQQYCTPTNNRLKTSSSTHNQAYMQGGRIYIHGNGTGNVGYAGKNVRNAGNAPQNVGYVGNSPRVVGNT
ncbi:hypothetical protein Tco_1351451 [Tanacetum coccineum]